MSCPTRTYEGPSAESSTRSSGISSDGGRCSASPGSCVAAAATSLDPEQLENPTARLRERITHRPETTAGRVGRAVLAIVAGLVIAFSPELALNLAALLVGGYLVFFGAAELLAMLQSPDAKGKVPARTGAAAASPSPLRPG